MAGLERMWPKGRDTYSGIFMNKTRYLDWYSSIGDKENGDLKSSRIGRIW